MGKDKPLRISEVKDLLRKDNNIRFIQGIGLEDIDTIKATKDYEFICDNGHSFKCMPRYAFANGKFSCSRCNGRVVIEGETDIATQRPDFVPYLLDKEDSKRYTAKSGKPIWWKCPYCGNKFFISPHQMSYRRSKCDVCGKVRSVAELFVTELLDQLFVIYEPQKSFIWSDRKIYDFYISESNTIVEVHGSQHYNDWKQKEIDDYKRSLAVKNGYNYIELNASDTSNKGLRSMVLRDDFLSSIRAFKDEIDWNRCYLASSPNRCFEVCKSYSEGIKDFDILSDMYGVCNATILSDLKRGKSMGLNVDYDPIEAKRESNSRKNKKGSSKPVLQYSIEGEFIQEFPSISEAARKTGASAINGCVYGWRFQSGGYRWKLKYEKDKCKTTELGSIKF